MIKKPTEIMRDAINGFDMQDLPKTFVLRVLESLEKYVEDEVNTAYKMGYEDAKLDKPKHQNFYEWLHQVNQ